MDAADTTVGRFGWVGWVGWVGPGAARLVAALALALLLLGGLAAAPAGAAPRSQTVERANTFIDLCFQMGGEPSVIMDSTGESITVVCTYPNGYVDYCDASTGKCTGVHKLSAGPRRLAVRVDGGALPQARPVPTGAHLALSGGRLVLVADDDER